MKKRAQNAPTISNTVVAVVRESNPMSNLLSITTFQTVFYSTGLIITQNKRRVKRAFRFETIKRKNPTFRRIFCIEIVFVSLVFMRVFSLQSFSVRIASCKDLHRNRLLQAVVRAYLFR